MSGFRMTRKVATRIGLGLWGAVVWWALISSLPHNPQSPGLRVERNMRLVLPEGWGFFTRNPREPDLIMARLDTHDAWELEPPHASPSNLFGLRRLSRVLPVESSQVLQDAKATFQPCPDGDWQRCIAEGPMHTVSNTTPNPKLCGDVAYVRREPVPWAWADLSRPEDMPTNVLRLHVECESTDVQQS